MISMQARKPREHLKICGVRLRRRWVEITGEECDLLLNLKECQHLHHDLLQADEEAFEEIIPQEGPKPPANVNIKQFKTIFVDPNGR